MHDLEKLITEWRKTVARDVAGEDLDELEAHLRETVVQLRRSGQTVPEAFQCAVAQLGAVPGIASEFHKLDQSLWLPIKIALGFAAIGVLCLTIGLTICRDGGRTGDSTCRRPHL